MRLNPRNAPWFLRIGYDEGSIYHQMQHVEDHVYTRGELHWVAVGKRDPIGLELTIYRSHQERSAP